VFLYATKLPQKVIALDVSSKMLERITDPAIKKVVCDARSLDAIKDDSLDVVLFCFAIHHISGNSVRGSFQFRDEMFNVARSKLRKTGKLNIIEALVRAPLVIPQKMLYPLTEWTLARSDIPMIFFHSQRDLSESMSRAFSIEVDELEIRSFPAAKGWIDPFACSYPGVIKIPTRFLPHTSAMVIASKK
jgi:hypothetical protein